MSQPVPKFMLLAAEAYIAYDKSDPFTRMRVMSHLKNGIATPMRATPAREHKYNYTDDKSGMKKKPFTPENAGEHATYDAQATTEMRHYTKSDGERVEFSVPTWKNMVRP